MIPTDATSMLRIPPHSAEAEQSVLGALLLDNSAFDRLGGLKEADFYRHEHRVIFSAIAEMLIACKTADVITLGQRLTDLGKAEDCGGLGYLFSLTQSTPSAASIRRYAEIVREKAVLRAMIAAADEVATQAFSGESAAVTLDRASSVFAALQRQEVRKVPRSLGDIAIERSEYYADVSDGKIIPGWRTHIPRLTAMLTGGLRPGGLYIVAARPSVGKSSFAQDLAVHFAQDDLSTLFLSLEMPESEVADRSIANLGRVSYSALLTGKMDGMDPWNRVSEACEQLMRLPMMLDDQPAMTLQDIRIKAKYCKGLKVLVLDYLQLCASTRKDGNRNSEIEEISRGLKALAKELGIAIIALSQLNRDVEKRANRRPILADLRDSGSIEQDADVVMFLWPVRDLQDGKKIIGLGIEKNRQGPRGDIALEFTGDIQRWQQSDEDINPAQTTIRNGRNFE